MGPSSSPSTSSLHRSDASRLPRRGADHVEDLHQLVGLRPELLAQLLAVLPLVASRAQREARLAGEERLGLHARLQGLQQLGEDAARRPHVDGGAVVLLHEDQLGGAVPASHHVLRQLTLRSRSHLDPRICNVALEREGKRTLRESHGAPCTEDLSGEPSQNR